MEKPETAERLTLREQLAFELLLVFLKNPETAFDEDIADAFNVADKFLSRRTAL